MDKALWLNADRASEVVDAADIDYAVKSVEELVALLGHELPPVRTRASEMLAIKELTLSAMWRSPDHWEMEPDPT